MANLEREILGLVEIESVTRNEARLAGILESRWTNSAPGRTVAGTHAVRRIGDSLLVTRHGTPAETAGGRPRVVLAGHIDTVPLADCVAPAIHEGRVFGRGACDMKAGVAVMLALLEETDPDEGFAERSYIFYAGEEGGADGNELNRVLDEEPWLRSVDLAILLEPTAAALELGCQGSMHVEVEFLGQACHSARPWLGRNPLEHALPWLDRMLHHPYREVALEGVTYKELFSLTQVHMGASRNVIPAALVANLNFRYAPDRSPEDAERFVAGFFPAATIANSRIVDHAPAGAVRSDDPLYRHLLESTGLPRRAKQAWTDVARFSAFGVPALNWGPGDPGLAHTKNESVEIAESYATLESMRRFLLGPGPAPGARR